MPKGVAEQFSGGVEVALLVAVGRSHGDVDDGGRDGTQAEQQVGLEEVAVCDAVERKQVGDAGMQREISVRGVEAVPITGGESFARKDRPALPSRRTVGIEVASCTVKKRLPLV